jgi:hypothetical protein
VVRSFPTKRFFLLDARLLDASSIYQTVEALDKLILCSPSILDFTSHKIRLPINKERPSVRHEQDGLDSLGASKPPRHPHENWLARLQPESIRIDVLRVPGEKRVAGECVGDLLALGMQLQRQAAHGQPFGKGYKHCHAEGQIPSNPLRHLLQREIPVRFSRSSISSVLKW